MEFMSTNFSVPSSAAASLPAEADPSEVELCPSRGWVRINVRELLHYRELLFFLIWRDVKVRYKQTVLGVAWAVLQPIFNVIMFTIIFGRLANFSSKLPEPYPLWVYASLLPWTPISTAISMGGLSLMNSQNLLTKVYFPRLFVPAAVFGGAMIDMLISAAVFLVMAACYGSKSHLHWTIVFVPLLLILATLIGLGFSFLLAALTVAYRDFRFVIPFLAQALMYGSFIMIPLPGLKLRWQMILSLNPVFGMVGGFRAAVFGDNFQPVSLAISTLTAIGFFVLGLFYFRKTERRFADIA